MAFSRLQQPGLCKARKASHLMVHAAFRLGDEKLQNFFARKIAGIAYRNGHIVLTYRCYLLFKMGVA